AAGVAGRDGRDTHAPGAVPSPSPGRRAGAAADLGAARAAPPPRGRSLTAGLLRLAATAQMLRQEPLGRGIRAQAHSPPPAGVPAKPASRGGKVGGVPGEAGGGGPTPARRDRPGAAPGTPPPP